MSRAPSYRLGVSPIHLLVPQASIRSRAVVDQLDRIVEVGAKFQDQTHDLRTHVNNLFRLHSSHSAYRVLQQAL